MPMMAAMMASISSSLLLDGQLEGVGEPVAGPGEEDDQQNQVHDAAGQAVDADRGDAGAGLHPGFLQVPGVQCHAADVGRGHPVDKRGGGLGQHGGPEPDPLRHRADEPGQRWPGRSWPTGR
jgi:hypothetical protein